VRRFFLRLLCRVGIHDVGIVGRYLSGDGPELSVPTCSRCGKEWDYYESDPQQLAMDDNWFFGESK
jgi:hypothetical protein